MILIFWIQIIFDQLVQKHLIFQELVTNKKRYKDENKKKTKLQRLITYLRLNKWQRLAWDNCHLNPSWVNLTRVIDLILINTNGYDSSWMFNWNLEEFLSTSVDKTI